MIDKKLEEISEQIRKGEPVGFLEAIAAINYQHTLEVKRKQNTLFARFTRWVKSAKGEQA